MKCYICGSETDLKTIDGKPICLSCLDERRDVVCADNEITYDGIKLDLENYCYWFEQDKLKNIKRQDVKNYKIGQKLDIHEDDVLETIVTKLYYDYYVQVENFRRSSCTRSPIKVDDNGYDDHYALYELMVCAEDVCFYRDTFILKGTRRNLVKEEDFSVDYDGGAEGLTIQIGSMNLNFWTNQDKDYFCDGYDVLDWQIEEKDDCTILSVDIAGLFQGPGGYDNQLYPDDILENHWDVEDRFGQIVEWDEWNLISTYNGKCSVVVLFPRNRRYTYNYDGFISVDDRVKVSGKLAGKWGIVEEIGKYMEEPYMQNVVEVMESAGDGDDDDEWDEYDDDDE